jgi:Tol biopolymer transport system component
MAYDQKLLSKFNLSSKALSETEVSDSAPDYGPSLSADNCEIYFNSDRSGGPGSRNIWMAAR